MNLELNKYIVRNFFATVDRDGMQAARQFLAGSFVASITGYPAPLNREEYIRFGTSLCASISGFKHNIDEIFAQGDRVGIRVHTEGVHTGELFGLPPSGKALVFSAAMIFRLKAGKIVEGWIEVDLQGLLNQSGAFANLAVAAVPGRVKNLN